MRPASPILAAALFALTTLALTGCETTRGNKLHANFEHVSDVTTTAHPNPKYASIATGIPPVPGSPTAADANGMQPYNDSEARIDPGAEKGISMDPRQQSAYRFVRQ
ncbi:MAG: hypothetical protein ACLGXA_19120 [Acidobacteriota bacterium]